MEVSYMKNRNLKFIIPIVVVYSCIMLVLLTLYISFRLGLLQELANLTTAIAMYSTPIILIVVVVNAIIGVAQEAKAEKSLEALQKLSSHAAKVIRNGKIININYYKIN